MTIEEVVLVDSADNKLGLAEKMSAHQQGLLHRAFSVFVFRNNSNVLELLLQQRAIDKYHCGGLWTNTVCSHPRDNESIISAGKRRLQEELGFSLELQQFGKFIYKSHFSNGLIEHELDHVLVGKYNDAAIVPNEQEVAKVSWITLDALNAALKNDPKAYTPWLPLALNVITKKNLELLKLME